MSIAHATISNAVASTLLDPQESNPTSTETAAERLPAGHHGAREPSPPRVTSQASAWAAEESAALEYRKPRKDLPDVSFRHSGWRPTRDRVFAALTSAGAPRARLERFEQCGCHAWVMRSVDRPDRLKLSSNKCHDRFCRLCGNERSRLIATNVTKSLTGKVQRFITLTLRTDKERLVVTLTRLIRCFSRLRASKLWRHGVSGGVAFLEIKRSATLDRWHCHFHVITEGRYMPHQELSRVWQKVTGDSFVVDIRIVKDPEKTARYVAKYAAKPIDAATLRDDGHLLEAIQAITGRRLVITFGTWRGISLTEPLDDGDWEPVSSLNALIRRARSGDIDACRILDVLKESKPCKTRAPPESLLPFSTNGGREL